VPVMMSSAVMFVKTFRATRKPFRARAKTVRLPVGITVRLQPGILFVFTPESFSRSPRNPFRLAPESPLTLRYVFWIRLKPFQTSESALIPLGTEMSMQRCRSAAGEAKPCYVCTKTLGWIHRTCFVLFRTCRRGEACTGDRPALEMFMGRILTTPACRRCSLETGFRPG